MGFWGCLVLHVIVHRGLEKRKIFTILMAYENQGICQHTARVGGSWILSG